MSQRYIFQTIALNVLGSVTEIDTPDGYHLHSWRHQCVTGTAVDSVIRVCWEKDQNLTSNALAAIPAEWAAPTVEWVKRWILKHT